MADYRVRVRRTRDSDGLDVAWLVKLVDASAGPSDPSGDVRVGVYPTQAEAIRRGCTALRFAQAGIPVSAAS